MSKEHKSAAEIRKLIALVKKKNCIWNREEHLYNKRNSLTKAWHDIAKNMHPSFDKMSTAEKNYAVSQLKTQWRYLRFGYRKFVIEEKKGKADSFRFHKEMEFLRPTLRFKSSENMVIEDSSYAKQGSDSSESDIFRDVKAEEVCGATKKFEEYSGSDIVKVPPSSPSPQKSQISKTSQNHAKKLPVPSSRRVTFLQKCSTPSKVPVKNTTSATDGSAVKVKPKTAESCDNAIRENVVGAAPSDERSEYSKSQVDLLSEQKSLKIADAAAEPKNQQTQQSQFTTFLSFNDADLAFYRSLEPWTKNFNDLEKLEFRSGIMDLIKRIQERVEEHTFRVLTREPCKASIVD